MSELKPCAHCGRSWLMVKDVEGYGVTMKAVCCRNCWATGPYAWTDEDAIEAWNRRSNDAAEARPYYEADLRRAISDMMERYESRDRRANDAD